MPAAPSMARPDLRLPAWVDDTVLWALAKRPEDRYHDVQTFSQMFRSGLERTAPLVTGGDAHLATEIIDTVPVWNPEPEIQPRPSVNRRAAGGLYRAGGRAARRSTRLRRAMWRLVGALIVANLMLAAIVWYDQGELPGFGSAGQLHAGATANVVTDDLNVRSSPGRDAEVLAIVGQGDTVLITGDSATAANEDWWPVEVTVNGQTVNGYIWEEGIRTDRSGLSGAIQTRIDRLKEIPSNVLDGAGL
jgi:hypothetical protein